MDGRDELCGQDALNQRERLHLEVSYKRLERGHFVWPATNAGRVSLSPAQVSMLLEGIDWRMPQRVRPLTRVLARPTTGSTTWDWSGCQATMPR